MILTNKKILLLSNQKKSISEFLVFLFILILFVSTIAISQNSEFKTIAKIQMEEGKYSEAIDLLNKHISSVPRDTDGYALRAECYEKTNQYYNAMLDWEKAVKLNPSNQGLKNSLEESRNTLHSSLREKIKGHEREIAIDPSSSENYLAIGKAYRQLDENLKAEFYYDTYLALEPEASPDEILRYTEILAKNNRLKKGENILKEFTEKYPDDWRLQSRYGYFLMWRGKYRTAKKSFATALEIKPYFKEAQDGMDVVSRKAYVTQNNPIPKIKEYPIDRYYRLLKKNPDNDEIRLKLTEELIKADRIEEAYNQYQFLSFFKPDNPDYEMLLNDFYQYRDSVYHFRIKDLQEKLVKNPKDKISVLELSEYFRLLEDYESAVKSFDIYFETVPNENDSEFLFQYAKALAWNREIDKSLKLHDELIGKNPKMLDYKLFRAQLSIWEERDLDTAELFINEVLSSRPNNVNALIAKATLLGINKEFDSAQAYLERIRTIDPINFDVITLQSKLEFQKLRAEEDERFQILEEGRKLVLDENCASALLYYEKYLAEARPNNLIKKEYGDVLFCAKQYDDALKIYDEILIEGYIYEAELARGKLYYATGDSVNALNVFNKLVEKEPYEFQPRLYLGDSYVKMSEFDSALTVYDTLLTWDLDSIETAMVKQRIAWIPPTGLSAIINSFPSSIGIAPAVQYYSDNLSFQFAKVGARIDIGIFKHLILGVSFYENFSRANAENLNQSALDIVNTSSLYGFTGKREITTFKGHVFIPFSKKVLVSGAYGIINSADYENENETEIVFKYDNLKTFQITGSYYNSDAQLILFSPYLIDYHDSNGVRLRASLYKLQAHYTHNEKLLISGFFDYITISDNNEGNNFQFRIGNKFSNLFSAGYEYFFQNYKYRNVQIYYSPRNYDSHCLWGEYQLEENDEAKLYLGGKLGYAPSVNQLVLEAHLNANYTFAPNFNVVGNISFGQSSQYNSAYRYLSINLHAYWSL